ncbi:metacaspase-2-like [Condylostylus longicornis]|uniref:metacaspase-2-like n=1 Tax=Condylostylus longicornis TaxID=2530218 RepID=UPI00244DCEFF|nr:metacaspase-2-like [Condylostylus longicornis]
MSRDTHTLIITIIEPPIPITIVTNLRNNNTNNNRNNFPKQSCSNLNSFRSTFNNRSNNSQQLPFRHNSNTNFRRDNNFINRNFYNTSHNSTNTNTNQNSNFFRNNNNKYTNFTNRNPFNTNNSSSSNQDFNQVSWQQTQNKRPYNPNQNDSQVEPMDINNQQALDIGNFREMGLTKLPYIKVHNYKFLIDSEFKIKSSKKFNFSVHNFHETYHGLIGNDILTEYSSLIDYKNKTLTMSEVPIRLYFNHQPENTIYQIDPGEYYYRIPVREYNDSIPIKTKINRYPYIHKAEIQKQIEEMLGNKIIQPSPSPHNSPVWVVSKKLDASGNRKYRIAYVFGRKIKLFTDHKPLVWLNSLEEPNSKLIRWKLQIQEYDYEIEYKKGQANKVADFLSRMDINFNENDEETQNNTTESGDTFQKIISTATALNLYKNQIIIKQIGSGSLSIYTRKIHNSKCNTILPKDIDEHEKELETVIQNKHLENNHRGINKVYEEIKEEQLILINDYYNNTIHSSANKKPIDLIQGKVKEDEYEQIYNKILKKKTLVLVKLNKDRMDLPLEPDITLLKNHIDDIEQTILTSRLGILTKNILTDNEFEEIPDLNTLANIKISIVAFGKELVIEILIDDNKIVYYSNVLGNLKRNLKEMNDSYTIISPNSNIVIKENINTESELTFDKLHLENMKNNRENIKEIMYVSTVEKLINYPVKLESIKITPLEPSSKGGGVAIQDGDGALVNDKRGLHVRILKDDVNKNQEAIVKHIKSFPVVESDYLRKSVTKTYISIYLNIGDLNIAKMYRLFKTSFEENNQECKITERKYRDIFNIQFNIGFFRPKKDQ